MSTNISDLLNSSMKIYVQQLICSSKVTGFSNLTIRAVITMWRFFRRTQSSLAALGWLMVPLSFLSLLFCLSVFLLVLLSLLKSKRPLRNIGESRVFVYLHTWTMARGQIPVSVKLSGSLVWSDRMCGVAVLWRMTKRASGCQCSVGNCWDIY